MKREILDEDFGRASVPHGVLAFPVLFLSALLQD